MIVPTAVPESFHVLQLVGFVLLIIGTMIYNEDLVLPFWGFNQNTKEAKKLRGDDQGNEADKGNVTNGTKNSFVHK